MDATKRLPLSVCFVSSKESRQGEPSAVPAAMKRTLSCTENKKLLSGTEYRLSAEFLKDLCNAVLFIFLRHLRNLVVRACRRCLQLQWSEEGDIVEGDGSRWILEWRVH